MLGFKRLIFGSQFLVIGLCLAMRKSANPAIIDQAADLQLAVIFVIVGLAISFWGVQTED